ncbi:protein SSUH2 homolog [Saccoglossus kowalevskii]
MNNSTSFSSSVKQKVTPDPPRGYDDLLREECVLIRPPTTPRPSPPPDVVEQKHVVGDGHLTKEEAKQWILCLAYDDRYPEHVLKHLKVNYVSTSYSKLHYKLYLFCEVRIVRWRRSPHRGGPVDDGSNGQVPLPWEIPVRPVKEFTEHTKTVYVPHSALVRACEYCVGKGNENLGYETIRTVICDPCDGRGWTSNGGCSACNSTGRKKSLKTSKTCWHCDGSRKIKWHIEMTVYFYTRIADYIANNLDIPKEMFLQSTHTTASPVLSIDEDNIKTTAKRFADRHLIDYHNERVLQQRVRVAPVFDVEWTYRNKKGNVWLYGDFLKAESTDLSSIK